MDKFIDIVTSEKIYLPIVYIILGIIINSVVVKVVNKVSFKTKNKGKDKRKDTIISLCKNIFIAISKYFLIILFYLTLLLILEIYSI